MAQVRTTIRSSAALPTVFAAVFALGACGDSPVAAIPEPDVAQTVDPLDFELQIDTLGLEFRNVWVRITALTEAPQEITMRWWLEADTRNHLWKPASFHKNGAKFFTQRDTARVWGNVPRAYDFRVVAQATSMGRVLGVDTLEVRAPRCPDGPPRWTCTY